MLTSSILEELTSARRIADHASVLGVEDSPATPRVASNHLGAVLADAILQAGVSYRTVVRTRVDRIYSEFPKAATLPGLMTLLEQQGIADFLSWKHHVKVSRFESLIELLLVQNISDTVELKSWLCGSDARDHLLSLHGIGPKTCDYLCCLVGIDCIAVDRHVRTFAGEAGVIIDDYDQLKSVVSCAADLLGIARRDFDSWIWQTVSTRNVDQRQLSFL
jgi:hypothetical protein